MPDPPVPPTDPRSSAPVDSPKEASSDGAWQPETPDMWDDAAAEQNEARREAIEQAWGAGAAAGREATTTERERRPSSPPYGSSGQSGGSRDGGSRGGGSRGGQSRSRGRGRGRGRSRRRRRPLRWILLGLGIVVLGAVAVVADGYWQSYRIYRSLQEVQPEITHIRSALQQGGIGRGDPFSTAAQLANELQAEVDQARFTFDWTSKIPVVGRPVIAARLAADAAGEEAQAATIVRDIVIEVLGEGQLTGTPGDHGAPVFENGVVDVQLIESLTPKLQEIVAHLTLADRSVRAIPDIPFFATANDLRDTAIEDSAKVLALATRTTSAMKLLPSFLAAGGERTYYLALQQNAALRGTGGSVLAFGLMKVADGALSLDQFGGILELDNPDQGIGVPFSPAVSWYVKNAHVHPRIANGTNYSPDFPTVARAWRDQAEKATGIKVDGVIAIDPFAVKEIISTFAPIRVEAYPDPISADNVVQVVEHDQFLLPTEQQHALPGELIQRMFTQLVTRPVDMLSMLQGMSKALSEKRMQIWSDRSEEQAFVDELGWDGKLGATPGDFLALAQENRIGNKLDYFLNQTIAYTATVGTDGDVTAEYTVTNHNDVPLPLEGSPGLIGPPRFRGLNRGMMNLYVPERAVFASVDPADYIGPGPDKVFPPGFVEHVEGAFRVLTQTIVADPAASRSLTFRYSVPKVIQESKGRKVYELTVRHQPMVNDADFLVKVVLPPGTTPPPQVGWEINGNVATYHTTLVHDLELRLEY